MPDDSSPNQHRPPDDAASGAGQGWVALSYLVGGMAAWGFIGWLIDQWLDLRGVATAIGSLVGAAGGVYLIVVKLGRG